VLSVDGAHHHSPRDETLTWELQMIDMTENKTGSIEFNVKQNDAGAFFPLAVAFSSQQLYCGVNVAAVTHTETGGAVPFSCSKVLVADSFTVG